METNGVASSERDGPLVEVRHAVAFAPVVEALVAEIQRRGLTVFARIDHAAGAREVGMELADELVIVFGSPRSGTPLMQADPRVGIELPLRLLVRGEGEQTVVAFRDPRRLVDSYELSGREQTLAQMRQLLDGLAAGVGG